MKFRANPKIKGTEINNDKYKLSQFADDISIIMDVSAESLDETVGELSLFAV